MDQNETIRDSVFEMIDRGIQEEIDTWYSFKGYKTDAGCPNDKLVIDKILFCADIDLTDKELEEAENYAYHLFYIKMTEKYAQFDNLNAKKTFTKKFSIGANKDKDYLYNPPKLESEEEKEEEPYW